MFYEVLKASTDMEHRAIEAAVNFKEIVSSAKSYSLLLEKFYGYYFPIERRLHEFTNSLLELGINLTERKKIHLLEHDLMLLGIKTNTTNLCQNLPPLSNVYQAMGVLYVLEGSTLGGQVIHKHLMNQNSFSKKSELKFHLGYENQTIQMWNQFKSSLNLIPGNHESEVIATAQSTFSTLKNWITQNG